jgi:hypothetical protein
MIDLDDVETIADVLLAHAVPVSALVKTRADA